MIIEEKNLSDEHLRRTPVFLLTGDLETARFFSTLSSAQSKFGTHLEKIMRSLCKLPVTEWKQRHKCSQKTLFLKTKIHNREPDFVILENRKVIVCENKLNAYNIDTKQAPTEQKSYLELKNFLSNEFDFVEIKISDFAGGAIDKRKRTDSYFNDSSFQIITGNELCEILEISYDDVMNIIIHDQEINSKLLNNYKSKPISLTPTSKPTTLINFMMENSDESL